MNPHLIAQANANATTDASTLEAAGMLLIYLFILVMIFIVGSWIFLRSSRRFLTSMQKERPAPTPTDDVWAMHKVPEEVEGQDEESDAEDENPD